MCARRVRHLEGAGVGVIERRAGPFGEMQAEQATGYVEGGGEHALQREIGLQRRFIDGVRLAPRTLCVVPPVPRFDGVAGQGLQLGALQLGARPGGSPDLAQQRLGGLRAAGHRVIQAVAGEVGKAQQTCALLPQRQDLADQGGVGGIAARHPCAPGTLPQVTSRREDQEWLDRGTGQGDGVAGDATLGGCLGGGGAGEVGQAIELGLTQHHLPLGFVAQHVLAEIGVQRGQALGDLRHAGAAGVIQGRAGAAEGAVAAFEQAGLVGLQRQAGALQRVDAAEQLLVEHDGAMVPGQSGRHLALDLLHRIGGVG